MKNPLTICLIDDDEIYKFTIKKMVEIKKLAENIITFPDGEVGINFLKENKKNTKVLPDVIFLDINMPIMDGFQFMDEYTILKPELEKNIVIYMITSSVDPIDLENSKKYSEITDFIVKPIKPKDLEEIISKIN